MVNNNSEIISKYAHKLRNCLNLFSMLSASQQNNLDQIFSEYSKSLSETPAFASLNSNLTKVKDKSFLISNNVIKSIDILNSFLSFIEIESTPPIFSTFNLNDTSSDYKKLFKLKYQISECPIETDIQPESFISGIKPLLSNCIFGLLYNSYEAISEKMNSFREEDEHDKILFTPSMKLSLSTDSTSYIITIYDNGMGIKDSDKPNIFTEFFTTKTLLRSEPGLSLYLIKYIIEDKHHGKISFDSLYGRGTTFSIVLPKKLLQR